MGENMSTIVGNKRNIQVLRGLSSLRSLLSCTPDGHVVDLWDVDDQSGRQKWNITLVDSFEDVYNIKVANGVDEGRVFLSCSPNGHVDLWNVDDGSGRQRWRFIPTTSNTNIPSNFNIMVLGGTDGGKIYLSCPSDGSVVDLWNEDDGSGRQQFQLQ
jgi:hypothetical protein